MHPCVNNISNCTASDAIDPPLLPKYMQSLFGMAHLSLERLRFDCKLWRADRGYVGHSEASCD